MTSIGSVTDANGPTQYLWRLLAPATGANDIVITNSGSVTVGSAVSYTGVSQSGFPDSSSATVRNSTTTSFGASTTTVADNAWVVCTSRTGNGFALTAGANTTMRSQPETTYFGGSALWDTGGAQTPAGSKTVTVTCTSQFFGGEIIVSIAPVAVSFTPSPDNRMYFM